MRGFLLTNLYTSPGYTTFVMDTVTQRFLALAAVLALIAPPAGAQEFEQSFDKAFAHPAPAPQPAPVAPSPVAPSPVAPPMALPPLAAPPAGSFEARLASLADASRGRIGVAAVDMSTGKGISVMGDQPFPLASTIKVAIVATFLEGVDQGRYRLSDRYALKMPIPSRKFSSAVAPVRSGAALSGEELIELAITRSDNHATDALLGAIGGPQAVTRWLRRAGIGGMRLDHDIATLVRDDGAIDPATTIELRDSTTPQAMASLLTGLYEGRWLSADSRNVLLGAMSRCRTGIHRMRALLPEDAIIGHKTGTLSGTSSDVGFIRTADGRTLALAIYVTGQGGRPGRESRIATIARAVYESYPGANRRDGQQVSLR